MNEGAVLNLSMRFEVITCYKCGTPFAVPADVRARWQANGEYFCCPFGHSQHYSESTENRLRKQLESARRGAELARRQRDRAENSARALRGHLTRQKKRHAAGTCPCCQRTFSNLRRHMEGQHADYLKELESK